MNKSQILGLPGSIDDAQDMLHAGNYVADRALATTLFLALKLKRPLFLEGEAGVGKTEIANVLAATLGRSLIRLQCYEGLDVASAVYEWNYAAQMVEIRLAEAEGITSDTIVQKLIDTIPRAESDVTRDEHLAEVLDS